MRLDQRFTFFGASVTAQSAPNGYFDLVKAGIEAQGGAVQRFAHGSCHFDDAGFHGIVEVGSASADACLIEWNTTGLARFHSDKVAVVIDRLLQAGILPIFLILTQDRNLSVDRECESQVAGWCRDFGLPLIDLRQGFPGMHLLRDTVHTTPEGARWYVERLLSRLQALPDHSAEEIATLASAWRSAHHPASVRFETLPEAFVLEEGQVWSCEFRRGERLSELLFDMTIGPDSPVVLLSLGGYERTLTIWDPWCHYDRRKLVPIIHESSLSRSGAQGRLSLRVLPDKPDYSQCRRPGFDHDAPRRLRVHRTLTANLELSGITINTI